MHPALESHLSKYRKLVPALALIGHLADKGVGPIDDTAVLRAVSFSEYLETHARRAYAAGAEAETSAAKAILFSRFESPIWNRPSRRATCINATGRT